MIAQWNQAPFSRQKFNQGWDKLQRNFFSNWHWSSDLQINLCTCSSLALCAETRGRMYRSFQSPLPSSERALRKTKGRALCSFNRLCTSRQHSSLQNRALWIASSGSQGLLAYASSKACMLSVWLCRGNLLVTQEQIKRWRANLLSRLLQF